MAERDQSVRHQKGKAPRLVLACVTLICVMIGITVYYVELLSTPMASRNQVDVMQRIKLLYEEVPADNFTRITDVLDVQLNEERRVPADDMAIGPKPHYFVGRGVSLDTIHTELNGFPYTHTSIVLQLKGGECIRPEDIRRSFPSDVHIEDGATACGTDAHGPWPCTLTYWRFWNNSITNPYVKFAFDHSSCVKEIDLNLVSPVPPRATTDSRSKTGTALPPYPAGH